MIFASISTLESAGIRSSGSSTLSWIGILALSDEYNVHDLREGSVITLGRQLRRVSYYYCAKSVSAIEATAAFGNELAHAQHPVDLLDAKPMKNIWHQGLESHVLDTSYVFRSCEVVRRPICTPFARVVDDCHQSISILG